MRLERLILAGGIALAALGCQVSEIVRKTSIPVENPREAPALEGPVAPREGYDTMRYEWGDLYLHQTTLLTPSLSAVESDKEKDAKTLEQRKKDFTERVISFNAQMKLKKKSYRVSREVFGENNNYSVNDPTKKDDLIEVIEGCLDAKPIDKELFARNYCRVGSWDRSNIFGRFEGKGIIIGGKYVLTVASLIYNHAASEEAKKLLNTKPVLGIITLKEMFEQDDEWFTPKNTKVLVVNPKLDLALLEITHNDFERVYTYVPIIDSKLLEEVYALSDEDPEELLNRFNLKNSEALSKEFTLEAIDIALALKYGVAAYSGRYTERGTPLYGMNGKKDRRGLVGLIAGNLERDGIFNPAKKFKNFHVVGGNLIRKFFEDYKESLKSGKKLEKLVLLEKFDPAKEVVDIPRPFDVTEGITTETDLEEKVHSVIGPGNFKFEDPPGAPVDPMDFFGSFISLAALAGILYSEREKLKEKWNSAEAQHFRNRIRESALVQLWKDRYTTKEIWEGFKEFRKPVTEIELPLSDAERNSRLAKLESEISKVLVKKGEPGLQSEKDIYIRDRIIYRVRDGTKVGKVGGIEIDRDGNYEYHLVGEDSIFFDGIESKFVIKGYKPRIGKVLEHNPGEEEAGDNEATVMTSGNNVQDPEFTTIVDYEEMLITPLGMWSWLEEQAKSSPALEQRIENIMHILDCDGVLDDFRRVLRERIINAIKLKKRN